MMRHSTQPIWQEIKAYVENQIISGTYTAGDKLPSLTEFANIYKCSSSTAQKVLLKLAEEGVITRKPSTGYYVMPCKQVWLRDKHEKALEENIALLIKRAKQGGYSREEFEAKIRKMASEVW